MSMNEYFTKEERLCSRKLLEKLLQNGSSFLLYPFRITSIPETAPNATHPAQIAITVSKRRFKKAVDRNKIKRLIREVYRKNKEEHLYSVFIQHNLKASILINYISNEILTYQGIEKKLILCLNRLSKEYVKTAELDSNQSD